VYNSFHINILAKNYHIIKKYTYTERASLTPCLGMRKTTCPGVVRNAFFERSLAGRPGFDRDERRRLVVVAEKVGRAEVGLRRPAESAETLREVGRAVDDVNPGPADQKPTPYHIEVVENQNVAK
jgi:hypothetical protein